MKRLAILAAAAALAAGGVATGASASQPTREPQPLPPGTTFDLDGICPFPAQILILTSKAYTLTFGNGSQILTGQLFVRVTNLDSGKLDSGKSLDLNISGPSFGAVDSNVLTLSGRSLVFLFPGDRGPGSPGLLVLTSGPVVLTSTETGVTVDMTSASVTDLCAALS
jgi:hypothetical protein